jgi:hypothetical protein
MASSSKTMKDDEMVVSPKERGESERESDAPTQRQPDMASA